MGTPDDGRPPVSGDPEKPAIRPRHPAPAAPPESRITITHRGPSSFTRVVAFGAWLLVFLLLVALLKGLNEWRLHRLKSEVQAMQAQSRPARTVRPPPPPEPVAPAGPSAPAMASVGRAEPAAPPALPVPDAAPPRPAEEAPKPARSPQLVELVMTPAPNGNFYVKGQINRREVMFVVDTGASAVSIPDKLRWQLNLTRGRYLQSATANGIAGMYETRVKDLTVGPLRFKDVPAVLYPNAPDDTVLLGMTALREVRMEQQGGRMVLQQLVAPEEDAASPAAPPPRLKKSIKACMGTDKVVNDRVLKCMQGAEEQEEPTETAK